MGFDKGRIGNNAGILWDQEKINRMLERHGLDEMREMLADPEGPEPQYSNETGEKHPHGFTRYEIVDLE